jgi:hypothetical protein
MATRALLSWAAAPRAVGLRIAKSISRGGLWGEGVLWAPSQDWRQRRLAPRLALAPLQQPALLLSSIKVAVAVLHGVLQHGGMGPAKKTGETGMRGGAIGGSRAGNQARKTMQIKLLWYT